MPNLKVTILGPLFEQSGLGTACRSYIHALHFQGVEISAINILNKHLIQDALVSSLEKQSSNADFYIYMYPPHFAVDLAPMFPKMILQTVWEAETIPEPWLPILPRVRAIWVPCKHSFEVLSRSTDTPIFVIPHCLPPTTDTKKPDYSKIAWIGDSDFVFYSVFHWQERKNPFGLVSAFAQACEDKNDAFLLLKLPAQCLALNDIYRNIKRVCRFRSVAQRIVITSENWSENQMAAIAERGNCYLSLHRGEGWCFPLFEAVARGTPAIATKYGGPIDYLGEDYPGLVDTGLRKVEFSQDGFSPGMIWADPIISEAVHLMRNAYSGAEKWRPASQNVARHIKSRYSIGKVGTECVHALHAIL
jgi:glycosyltransferase involved in cell wall biosynthesis